MNPARSFGPAFITNSAFFLFVFFFFCLFVCLFVCVQAAQAQKNRELDNEQSQVNTTSSKPTPPPSSADQVLKQPLTRTVASGSTKTRASEPKPQPRRKRNKRGGRY